jgi:alginate O-acetyltransferase complex protein AlgI
MLFNSYSFLFIFLPVVLTVFHVLGRATYRVVWLVSASFFFYAWWNPSYLGLILFSIAFNYTIGVLLERSQKKNVLIFGVIINLCVLGYFKYTNFFVDNINSFFNVDINFEYIILPLAISFFTFQQIAYLVDVYLGKVKESNFLDFCLFVTFFPQLIAGPIVHHKEMLPQFSRNFSQKIKVQHFAIGLSIFIIGLVKKVVIADGISVYATPIFDAAEQGMVLTLFESWGGALAYSFQLYFDFSGYSDMAIGIARMFGVKLPLNFNSPYKATSIIDFWRRWHITLSRFLRDYVYIPLGGNRQGYRRRYLNIFITMLLGGIWHGAGWTFALWGGLHGLLLVANQFYRKTFKRKMLNNFFSWLITFVLITILWVLFRAQSIDGAMAMYYGMFGFNGISLPQSLLLHVREFQFYFQGFNIVFNGMFFNGVFDANGVVWIVSILLVTTFLPNTQQIMSYRGPINEIDKEDSLLKLKWLKWQPNLPWAMLLSIFFVMAILGMSNISEFLYFQF